MQNTHRFFDFELTKIGKKMSCSNWHDSWKCTSLHTVHIVLLQDFFWTLTKKYRINKYVEKIIKI